MSPRPPNSPTPAIYRRRRLAALLGAAGVVLLLFAVARSCGGGESTPPPPLSAEQARQAQLAENPIELTMSVSGDLLIHSPVYARALELGGGSSYDFRPMLRELRPYVADADLAICHLETPLTEGVPAGYPLFAAPAELANAVARTGWDACDTASNHTLDGGQEGVDETLGLLDRAGIAHTGSYDSRRDRRRPTVLDVEGARIALLAYTTDTNGLLLPKPFSVNVAERPEEAIEDARRAREAGADAVIVNIHWGSEITPEYVSEPSAEQGRFARKLAKSTDVTAVVGQGPHVVQPIRFHGDTPVIYSEGNLLSNQGAAAGLTEASQDGLIALLDLVIDEEGDRVTAVRYVPTWVRQPDYTVLPVPDALSEGAADLATLEASYARTTNAVGKSPGVTPVRD